MALKHMNRYSTSLIIKIKKAQCYSEILVWQNTPYLLFGVLCVLFVHW